MSGLQDPAIIPYFGKLSINVELHLGKLDAPHPQPILNYALNGVFWWDLLKS